MGNNNSLLIVGSGALACLFAARLAETGIQVTMLGTWTEGLQALRRHGVRLVDDDGTEQAHLVYAINKPDYCSDAQFALVLVKSWQTERAARHLTACLSSDGLALTLQNGYGNRETLAQHLGSQRVALGSTTTGATLVGPGRVHPGGEGIISLELHASLKPLREQFRNANFVVETAPDTNALIWGKLVISAAINPLAALLRVPNGELLHRPTARALLGAIAREAAAVVVANGTRLPYPDPVIAAETVARRTAPNRSSMLQDVLRGAPTEIDAICGAIVKTGESSGTPTPINRTLWRLVKALTVVLMI